MCFSFEASIGTFIVGTLSTFLIFKEFKNNKVYKKVGIFWLAAVLMQLWEAMIWKNYHCEFATKMALITNLLQPFIFLLILPEFLKKNKENKKKRNIKLLIVFFSLIIYSYYVYNFSYFKDYGCILKNNTVNLEWWNDLPNKKNYGSTIYIIIMIINMKMLIPNSKVAHLQIFIFILSLVSANVLNYRNYQNNVGSVWCLFASLAPVINYLVFKHNKKLGT